MAYCQSSSSTSAISRRQIHGPPCHCERPTTVLMSWTDANPGRRFYKCEEHGFFKWADEEKPGGWQKESLLEARDMIRRYKNEINSLNASLRETKEQMAVHQSEYQPLEPETQGVDPEVFIDELVKRERMLRQMFVVSWVGFIVLTATIVYLLRN